jgi:FdhD protein
MTDESITCSSIWRWRADAPLEAVDDALAVEEPVEIRVRGKAVSVTMRTPGHDDELGLGFLLSEGMITGRGDVARVDPCAANPEGNVLNVFLAPHVEIDWDRLTRHVFASSSCGLCGKASIESVFCQFSAVHSRMRVEPAVLQALPDRLREAQATFGQTGGLHAAALFDPNGELIVLREDVGRHNAVDKALGHMLLQDRLPLNDCIMMVSGRSSFEIMQKALAGGVAMVAAVSAPSSLAVEFARDSGQTLVGFLRPGRMNIYAHAERIALPAADAARADQANIE